MPPSRRAVWMALAGWLLLTPSALGQEHEFDPDALKAFQEMVQAYRQRPMLLVKTTVEVQLGEGDLASKGDTVEARFALGKGGWGVLTLRDFTIHVGGGKVTAIHKSTDHSYFSVGDDDSPYYVLMNLFQDIPFPHLALAFGEESIEDLCMQFHQKAPWARPTSVDTVVQDERTLQRIKLTSDFDDMTVLVDPETGLIDSILLRITGGDLVQPGVVLTYRHSFEYEMLEAPFDEKVFAFDAQNRQRVDTLLALIDRPPAPEGPPGMPDAAPPVELVGKEAPSFILERSDGGTVDMEDLRGQAVVLDFWATWCGPCRRALPKLHEVAEWAAREQLPATVITVNVWEMPDGPENTPEGRLKAVRAFWTKHGFTLPVAMDYSDETAAAYGIQGVPATFIIRSDGVVHAQHSGYHEGYADRVKGEIIEAIEALESDE